MTVTHPVTVRDALANYVVDQLDLISPPGKLVLQTSGGAAVATLTFSNPAFGNSSSGTATANAISDDTNAVGGTIVKGEMRNGGGTPQALFSVTATGGGGDLQMNSVVVSAGQTVRVAALTYSGPP
jgi:hypothetical protein